ncbi:MAG: hypothetical protein Q7T71_07400 [Herbiconiux sp.]|nr:hypothetical protein [Herbiconiux sp.]
MGNPDSEPTPEQWPSLTWERQVRLRISGWSVHAEFGAGGQPYKSSIPPTIAALTPEPDTEPRAAAEVAVRELSRFDARSSSLR